MSYTVKKLAKLSDVKPEEMTGPQWVEMSTASLTALFLPGAALKGAHSVVAFSGKFLPLHNTIGKRPFVNVVKNPEAGKWDAMDISFSGHRRIEVRGGISRILTGGCFKKNPEAPYLISGHGSENAMFSKSKPWDHKKIVAFVKNKTAHKEGQPLCLWGCSTGKGKNSLGQRVADELGEIVIAPTGILNHNGWTTSIYVKTPIKWLNKFIEKYDLPFYGQFRTFYPRPGQPSPQLMQGVLLSQSTKKTPRKAPQQAPQKTSKSSSTPPFVISEHPENYKDLATRLKKTPSYKPGTPITLLGKDIDNYAPRLANKVGAPVTGKFKTYYPGEWRPKYYVGDVEYSLKRELSERDLGKYMAKILYFNAEMTKKGNKVTIEISNLAGSRVKIRNWLSKLKEIGKRTTADVLEIEAYCSDFPEYATSMKLRDHLVKHHNFVPIDVPERVRVRRLKYPLECEDSDPLEHWIRLTVPLKSVNDGKPLHPLHGIQKVPLPQLTQQIPLKFRIHGSEYPFLRTFSIEDLGNNVGGIKSFAAEMTMKTKEIATIEVRRLIGEKVQLRNFMKKLTEWGSNTGANKLEIVAQFNGVNPEFPKSMKLRNFLMKHYNCAPVELLERETALRLKAMGIPVEHRPIDFIMEIDTDWYKMTIDLTKPVNKG